MAARMNDAKGNQIGTVSTVTTVRRVVTLNLGYWITNMMSLRNRLSIPVNAEQLVQIPGGADWSNEQVSVDELDVVIRWERTETDDGDF